MELPAVENNGFCLFGGGYSFGKVNYGINRAVNDQVFNLFYMREGYTPGRSLQAADIQT